MKIGVPAERPADETRVALIPPVAEELLDDGHEVVVESGAGERSDWADDAYRDVGCTIVDERQTVFDDADVIFQLTGLGAVDGDIDPYAEDQIVVGMLGPWDATEEDLETLANRNVSAFALELIPRISRAQSMDANSSMASIGGYKAAVMAAEALPKLFPMEMTAAGTVQPADVFVIGAGVAGLKAIATAERMGASCRAYDIRLEVKREVESLGADFVELDLETEDAGDEEGYAREMDDEFYAAQREEMRRVVPESDVVITTAAIPGAPAPEIVSADMIAEMDDGSVVVDLSAASGGNCEPSVADETVTHEGVTIFGPTNLPATVPHTASQLYANNVANFLDALLDEEGNLEIDLSDDVVDSTLLVHDGTVRNPHVDEGTDADDDADEETGDGAAESDAGDEEGVEIDED